MNIGELSVEKLGGILLYVCSRSETLLWRCAWAKWEGAEDLMRRNNPDDMAMTGMAYLNFSSGRRAIVSSIVLYVCAWC